MGITMHICFKTMTERPIIFSTPMVQAIIAGRKTVTRRLNGLGDINTDPDEFEFNGFMEPFAEFRIGNSYTCVKIPYEKGDILWVRESFMPFDIDGKKYNCFKAEYEGNFRNDRFLKPKPYLTPKWKPSIHMPKTIACRWLRVENVRIERLHKMNDNDCTLEGIYFDNDSGYWFAGNLAMASTPLQCFQELWSSINGRESYAIDPWVWVIQFSVLNPEESQKCLDHARAV